MTSLKNAYLVKGVTTTLISRKKSSIRFTSSHLPTEKWIYWAIQPWKREVKILIMGINYFTKGIEAQPLATITA